MVPAAKRLELAEGKRRAPLPAANVRHAAQRDHDGAVDVPVRQPRDEQGVDDAEDHAVAATPSASVNTAAAVTPRDRASARTANRTSCAIDSSICVSRHAWLDP